jgi:hypothetical protein
MAERMPSSGVRRRVDVVDWTDVSEDRIVSIFRVEKFASEEPASVQSTRYTRRHTPEDGILHSHRRENLKSYNMAERRNYPISFSESHLYLILRIYVQRVYVQILGSRQKADTQGESTST